MPSHQELQCARELEISFLLLLADFLAWRRRDYLCNNLFAKCYESDLLHLFTNCFSSFINSVYKGGRGRRKLANNAIKML